MLKAPEFKTPEEYHSKLSLLFNATIALPLLPYVLLFLEIQNNGFEGVIDNTFYSKIIGYVASVLGGFMVLVGFQKYQRQMQSARNESGLKGKLESHYKARTDFFIWQAIGASIMAFCLWITAEGVIIVAYVILLFFMTFHMPTPKRYVKELALQDDEKDVMLNKKDEVI